jgi:hypothetical protein
VAAGAFIHFKGGEIFSPSHVYFAGIIFPSLNTSLSIEKAMTIPLMDF